MFALRQEPCDAGYRHLSTTYGCYKMRIMAGCEVQCKVQFHIRLELTAGKRERPFFPFLPFTVCCAGAFWTSKN